MTSAPEPAPAGTSIMQRILGAIERGGNKMPNPAILFVWLCVIVIVLSALLAWADIKVTYQVVEPLADRRRGDGSRRFHATFRRPAGRVRPGRRVHGPGGNGGNQEPAVRRWNPLSSRSSPTSAISPPSRSSSSMIGVGLGGGRRTDRGADPEARQGLVGGDADADPRLHRCPLSIASMRGTRAGYPRARRRSRAVGRNPLAGMAAAFAASPPASASTS